MQANNIGGLRECFIPWDSVPAYGSLLKNQNVEFNGILLKKQFMEITEQQAEEQTAVCVQQFIHKEMEFLKLYNVRFVMPEERKTENMLEKIFFNVVQVQNQLIANRLKDNTEVFGKIAQLRNELKNDFRDSWGQKIADLLA